MILWGKAVTIEKQFGPIVVGDEIKSQLRQRLSKLEFKTVTAAKMTLVFEKVAIAEREGWRKHQRNKKSYRISRPKPADERLEDEVWCILARMGFHELSLGRNFQIEIKKDPNPRQIDVFAKDDEVALVVECTQCSKPTTKDMSALINKVSDFKNDVSKAISAHYGRELKIKPKFIIATRNVRWGDADIEKCAKRGIAILTDTEIDYYNDLTLHLKSAARFQFLAHLFSGTEIPALSKVVPATQGTMGGVDFYNFLIEPDELLKISYVGHKASRVDEDIDMYQRMLQPNRLRSIAAYINKGGKFPTNIVINIKTPRKRKLKFEGSSPNEEVTFGALHLPNRYGSAWVIDGQHRLYGYAYRNLQPGPKNDKSVLPVLAFENLDAGDEMDMFIDINSKQVKVKTSLLIELYADLHWNSPDPAERLLALQARTVTQLNRKNNSPIFDRVVVVGKGKTAYRCLTATTLSDGIKHSRLLGSIKKGFFYPGPLAHHSPDEMEKALSKATGILSRTLNLFAEELPEHWGAGDKKGEGYLCTNIGVRSILLVVSDICAHVRKLNDADLSTWTENEVFEEVEKYIQPVVDYFVKADNDQIQTFRKQGSSLASVKKQSMGMNVFISQVFKNYRPDGLDNYLSERDQKGNEAAVLMVNRTQDRIFHHVIRTLKAKFGEENDAWWVEGIPSSVRMSCTNEWESKKRRGLCESYLYLINYQDIATANWKLFGGNFALDEKDTGNRKKCVEWIKQLNDIRSKTHHPERGKLTAEEIEFVEKIAQKVELYFPSID